MGKTVCIDFDDTLCKSDGEPVEGSFEALRGFKQAGYTILIFSARLNPELWGELIKFRSTEISDWLEQYNMPYDNIVSHKPPADVYIDNKGYRFEGDWKKAFKEILELLDI